MLKTSIKNTFILIALAIMLISGTARAEDSAIIYDQYFTYKIKDAQIGYGHIIQKIKKENGKNLIVTNRHFEQKFQRFGFPVKTSQDSEFIEDESGKPMSFSSINKSLGENSEIQGVFTSPDKASISSTINGINKKEEIKLNKIILFPFGISNLFKDNAGKNKIEYSTLDPSVDFRIINYSAEKIGNETLNNDNLSGNYDKYTVVMDLLPNISSLEWHDNNGRTVRELSSILNIEAIAVPKDKIFVETKSFDILNQSLIPVNTTITNPLSVEQINYKVEAENNNPESVFISDNRQRIIQITGNTAYLKVKSEGKPEEKYAYPVNTKGLDEFLKSGPFITSNDDAIKTQAIAIAGQEKDAYNIAKTMEKWVYTTITKKDFSINFADAKEILKTKEGDCTEHSILLASILRAAGIPSKVVIGLMYTDKPEKAFAYHMWVKAYIGKWINLDPSFPDENFSPVHIALYETALNNTSNRTDLILNLIKSFSNLKINILNYSQKQQNTPILRNSSESLPFDDTFKVSNFFKNDDNLNESISENTIPGKTVQEYIKSAYINYSQGKTQLAYEDYKKASDIIPYNDDYLEITLAQILAEAGFFNMAAEKLNSIYNSEIWSNKISEIKSIYFPSKLLTKEKELILADALTKTTFLKDPANTIKLINSNKDLFNNDYAHYILAKAYNETKETKAAIDKLNKIVAKNPGNLSYRFELALAYISKNDLSKAKDEMNVILKNNIIDEKFLNQVLVQNYWLNFKIERKNKLKSQYYLAKYYQTKGDLNTSIEILNKLIDEKYKDNSIYTLLGDLYLSLSQFEKAELNYRAALKLDKDDILAIKGLGDIKFQTKNYRESLPEYLKADKISNNSVQLLTKIAENYKLLSQEEKAYSYYNKALSIDNVNYKANHDLGMIYSEMGDLKKARYHLIKALSIKPDNSELWLELAKIEINNKNYFLAKTYLIPVNHINNQNPDYYYYLGLIYKKNENFSEARSNFNTALEIRPQFSEVLKELKSLNSITQQ